MKCSETLSCRCEPCRKAREEAQMWNRYWESCGRTDYCTKPYSHKGTCETRESVKE